MKTGRKVYPKRPLSGAAACKRCLWALLLGLSVLSCTVQGGVLRVTLLGTGGPPPDPKRSGPGVLIEAGQQRLLFDAGRGVVERLTQAGVELPTVGPVFLTHL